MALKKAKKLKTKQTIRDKAKIVNSYGPQRFKRLDIKKGLSKDWAL